MTALAVQVLRTYLVPHIRAVTYMLVTRVRRIFAVLFLGACNNTTKIIIHTLFVPFIEPTLSIIECFFRFRVHLLYQNSVIYEIPYKNNH